MSANDKQIGGDHYKSDYQHWDFVTDHNLPYLIGCATKYVQRWRNKNGIEDLEKTKHYIEKIIEKRIFIININSDKLSKFVNSIDNVEDYQLMCMILSNQYADALTIIDSMVETYEQEACNPSTTYITG